MGLSRSQLYAVALQEYVQAHQRDRITEQLNAVYAEEEYKEEERAFRVAWAAVKRDYEKGEDGNWHKKEE